MCVETRSFLFFANNSRSKQNKKNPEYAHIGKKKKCAKFQQKKLNSVVLGARQSFQFLRQKTWFLENNRALPKLQMGLCIT